MGEYNEKISLISNIILKWGNKTWKIGCERLNLFDINMTIVKEVKVSGVFLK